jgi:hypothetical protein
VAFYGWPLPLTLAEVAMHLAFVGTLVAATIVTVIGAPRLGFLGVWFFGILAPTSSIVPIVTEVGAERRMYLPLAALIVLAVVAVWRLLGSKALIALAVALAAALAITTAARNGARRCSPTQNRDCRPRSRSHVRRAAGEQWPPGRGDFQPQRAIDLGNTRARFHLGRIFMAKAMRPQRY